MPPPPPIAPALDGLDKLARVLSGGLLPALQKVADLVAQPVLSAFRTLADVLGKTAGLVPGLTSLGKAVGGLVGFAGGATAAVVALGLAMRELVRLANPVAAEQFTLALNDLMAVLGQALLPVFRLVTEVVRAFADTLITFAGDVGATLGQVLRPLVEILKVVFEVLGRVGQAFADVFAAVGPALTELGNVALAVFKAIQPLIDLLVDLLGGALGAALSALGAVIEALAPVIIALADAVGGVIKLLAEGVRELLALLGIDIPDRPGTRPGASVGAAVRQASTTDVESVLRKSRENAFSLGTAAADPARRTADATSRSAVTLDRILEKLNELPEKFSRKVFGDTFTDFAKGVFDTLGDVKNTVLDAGRDALTAVGLRAEDKPGGAFEAMVRRADGFRARAGDAAGAVGG